MQGAQGRDPKAVQLEPRRERAGFRAAEVGGHQGLEQDTLPSQSEPKSLGF